MEGNKDPGNQRTTGRGTQETAEGGHCGGVPMVQVRRQVLINSTSCISHLTERSLNATIKVRHLSFKRQKLLQENFVPILKEF